MEEEKSEGPRPAGRCPCVFSSRRWPSQQDRAQRHAHQQHGLRAVRGAPGGAQAAPVNLRPMRRAVARPSPDRRPARCGQCLLIGDGERPSVYLPRYVLPLACPGLSRAQVPRPSSRFIRSSNPASRHGNYSSLSDLREKV